MGHDLRRPALPPRRPARLKIPLIGSAHTRTGGTSAARAEYATYCCTTFYAKIELLFFIGHLYVPDVSFAPHQ
ncbi:hypothetical protein EGT41_00765 [Burkholderia cenocepacia]|uniref:Uncharacterized protein n=1 Tax=Burkholderia cenocepacia TaxID=95486 RepID=A0A427NWW3_9BURK|nr:hypothetical protein EGT41_00765 [Burkholderia cenocepacia]